MRAAVLRDREPGLEIVELAIPTPKAGEALVKIIACGVCHTDLHVIKGEVTFPRPAVLGHEISGAIIEIGAGTSDARGLAVGDTVVGAFIMPCATCPACRRGRDDLCENFFGQNRLNGTLYDGESRLAMPDGSFLAMYSMGGLAEYAVVPVTALAKLAPGLDPVTSAVLGCSALTSYGAVHRAARVEPGEAVAVVAVGGVGSGVVQMARAAGAVPVIAVDVSADKLEAARALGATHVVDASTADPVAAVREITGGRGVDVSFEALGRPQTFRQAVDMLADGGRMVAIGIAAGSTTAEIEITPLVRRATTISGSYGARTREDLPAVVALAADRGFDTEHLVTRRFGLEDAAAAYETLARGEITGRAVIVMA
ncbi:zinc-binding dehydrogenase [Pseudolysinimonas kribbensis]|uniref:Succinate-semialdehyde dehydrogenase n=1 Tax=Pseudolysinimonas kribbensis TaxID=433641 RepID=A0ABQ6K224_9MICO|nr:zinc-binding dehydrogenase [Pseudolysinimonas kribbensis]GMA94662.1 succinate-semialdehyde dehydrogenase [Pseudolysinimonas kribbensis]